MVLAFFVRMPAAKMNPQSSRTAGAPVTAAKVKTASIVLFALGTLMLRLNLVAGTLIQATFLLLFVFALLHGSQRYGWRIMATWFAITWVVSNGFESLSIATGFPFGHYHYTPPGPRIGAVPILIMPTYFGIGYVSWCVTQVLTGQFGRRPTGWFTLIVPLLTALVMTMWDLATDPQASTIQGTWIWENGGAYFGVPVSNFVGWVFVVYVFMQIFALYLARFAKESPPSPVVAERQYWMQPIALYLIMGLGVLLEGFVQRTDTAIYTSMAMISVFTMVFTGVNAWLTVHRSYWRA